MWYLHPLISTKFLSTLSIIITDYRFSKILMTEAQTWVSSDLHLSFSYCNCCSRSAIISPSVCFNLQKQRWGWTIVNRAKKDDKGYDEHKVVWCLEFHKVRWRTFPLIHNSLFSTAPEWLSPSLKANVWYHQLHLPEKSMKFIYNAIYSINHNIIHATI